MLCLPAVVKLLSTGVGGFNALKALSTRNDDPATQAVLSIKTEMASLAEGSGVLMLETLEHAKNRGAKYTAK